MSKRMLVTYFSATAAHWVPGHRVAAGEGEAKLAKWVDGLGL